MKATVTKSFDIALGNGDMLETTARTLIKPMVYNNPRYMQICLQVERVSSTKMRLHYTCECTDVGMSPSEFQNELTELREKHGAKVVVSK